MRPGYRGARQQQDQRIGKGKMPCIERFNVFGRPYGVLAKPANASLTGNAGKGWS